MVHQNVMFDDKFDCLNALLKQYFIHLRMIYWSSYNKNRNYHLKTGLQDENFKAANKKVQAKFLTQVM